MSNYIALQNLTSGLPTDATKSMYICIYCINSYGKSPFLQYMLLKNTYTGNCMKFPECAMTENTTVESICDSVLSIIFENTPNVNCIYHGYKEHDDAYYLFYNCTTDESIWTQPHHLTDQNTIWFALIDEIVNHRQVYKFPVNNSVTSFFVNNPEFMFINDETESSYDVPVVLYHNNNYNNNIALDSVVGIVPSLPDAMLGPCYYFTDYKNMRDNQRTTRYAIFIGNLLVKMNKHEDDYDKSELTKHLLESNIGLAQYMRLSDRDATWKSIYDSVYIGNVELDNGSMFSDAPLWAIRDYEQITMLSYH